MEIPESFTLKIFDENGLIYDQEVVAVTVENELGSLNILPGHTNFISTIKGSLSKETMFAHLKDGTTKGFLLDSGVIKVYENQTEVFLVLDFGFDVEALSSPI